MSALLWFAIWAALIFLMIRFGCGAHVMGRGQHGDQASGGEDARWEPPVTDLDPVCKKTVKTDNAKPSVFDGHVYYFCSRECREIFEAAPDLYTKGSPDASIKQLGDSRV